MAEQSRGDQRKIIERAQKQGELDDLYWYVSFDLPLKFGSLLKPKTSAGAKHRGGVPVISTGPDPEASAAEIELLRWHFEDNNRGRGLIFHAALTTKELLDSICPGWYIWGEANTSIDNICPDCGQVHTTEYHEPWACCGWSQTVRVNEYIISNSDE